MKMYVSTKQRKDKKIKTTLVFDNGKRFVKLWTMEQVQDYENKATDCQRVYVN